jgi:hypothetical protein
MPGYTQDQLDDAQARYGLRFPPDLVDFYREQRIQGGWDWTRDEQKIRSMLAWPFEGLLFDIEHNTFWLPDWGERPESAEARAEVLRAALSFAPKLIPLFSHRYIPETPHEGGNPVFSVYQSDIIHYGADLHDYLDRERYGASKPWPGAIKRIPFWTDIVEGAGCLGYPDV